MTQFLTLSEAIDWTRQRWDDRAAPIHLHSRGVEPDSRLGAPRLAGAFLRWLMTDVWTVRQDQVIHEKCEHWRLPIYERITACPDCEGLGFMTKYRDAYLYPMSRALVQLRAVKAMRPHQPRPYTVIYTVAMYGWDWRQAAAHLGYGESGFEALALMSFRKLADRYHIGEETKVSWTAMSESQRNAVMDGEGAA